MKLGDRVEKVSGSSWRGRIVGTYSTDLTPDGYAVESENEPGSVQIYPSKALRPIPSPFAGTTFETRAEREERENPATVRSDDAEWLQEIAMTTASFERAPQWPDPERLEAIAARITADQERIDRLERDLAKAQAYLEASAAWTDEEMKNPIIAIAAVKCAREGVAALGSQPGERER